ncbi:MAG TPA: hypothetical protein VJG65_02300 [Patescibacteria group bacterium]|nr:hypothetical protein [Patescibacteria group bacterium]
MKISLKTAQLVLLLLTAIAAGLLVYQPHWNYPFPFHVDEWHHISEASRLGNYGEYFEVLRSEWDQRFTGLEIGFHFFLFLLSFVFDLVLIYQYLPAIWMAVIVLILFYVIYQQSGQRFFLAWLAMIFFVSIKSNVNLLGLWFFTPLTFSFPFILLYLYFFNRGFLEQNKKYLLISLGIMIFLLPTHSLAVLFALPALLVYALINYRYLFKEYKFFLLFLIIPVFGLILYKLTLNLSWPQTIPHLFSQLMFRHGWGVLELKNSLVEIYNWLGYLFALAGVIFIFFRRQAKEHALYLLLLLTLFILIVLYRLTGISFFSPYQRNLYYLVLLLPWFSAIGLFLILQIIKKNIAELSFFGEIKKYFPWFIQSVIISIVIILLFVNYYQLPPQIDLYQVINQNDYQLLKLFSDLPKRKVMALPFMSTALYPISRQEPVATLAFYGDKKDVEEFFGDSSCIIKSQILKKHEVKYIISPEPIDCNFGRLYQKYDNYVYQIQ